jgi:hypothetical protein
VVSNSKQRTKGTKVERKWNESGTKVERKWNESGTKGRKERTANSSSVLDLEGLLFVADSLFQSKSWRATEADLGVVLPGNDSAGPTKNWSLLWYWSLLLGWKNWSLLWYWSLLLGWKLFFRTPVLVAIVVVIVVVSIVMESIIDSVGVGGVGGIGRSKRRLIKIKSAGVLKGGGVPFQ